MPASQEQKVDFLLKKIGYSASKTGIAEDSSLTGSTKKAPFAEAIASPLVIPASTIWSESGLIPATPPGSDTAYVKVYSTSSAYRMTHDATVGAARRTFIARSSYGDQSSSIDGDWIDTQFGADYIVQVYKGDPNSGGVALQQAGANAGTDGWFFDYSSGVLNFNGTNLPSGITETNIYIVGYRYTGRKGVQPEAGIGTFHDLIVSNNFSVGGISTFTGLIDANGIIEATAGQNKIPSLYSAFSDLPNAGTYHGMFAHVHATGRGYFAHAGNWMELVNKETTGVVGTGTERYDIGPVDATSLNVTGITTLGSIGISTGRITGPSITYIDPATVGAAGTVVILGNLQVDGTQTTVNSSTMTVTDKNIELAKGAANDAAADGGGITVKSGDGDKTWQWVDATDSWTSSEHIRVPDNRVFGFASDANTYIGRPAADTIAFTNGGNESLRINSDGDVIIGSGGVWSYSKALNVQGSSGSIISLYNGDTTTYAANTHVGIEFKLLTGNTGTVNGTCQIQAFKENGTNGDSARALSFYTGTNGGSPTERLRITSDGRLQIGSLHLTDYNEFNGPGRLNIQNNSADGTVDFSQGIVFTDNVNNQGTWTHAGIVATGGGAYNGNLVFGTDSTGARDNNAGSISEKMRISSIGNVGIGTNDPDFKVESYGTDASIIAHYPSESRGGIAAFENKKIALVTTNANDNLVFGYSNPLSTANFVERMRIDNGTGNVGIGTDNPDTLLHLHSSSPILKIEDVTSNSNQFTRLLQVGAGFRVQLRSGSNDGTLTVQGYGNNTTTDFIRVENDGKVGINSSSPTSKLDVVGDVKISGVSTFSGNVNISGLSKRLLIGDITGSPVNYLGIQQVAGSSIKGFATQYDNASVFENLQGSMHQHLVLGDSTSGNNGTIFGISLTESGTTYERLKLTGVGDLTVARDLNVTRNLDVDGTLDVDGNTELDDVNVSGDLDVDGHTELDNLNVSGVSTFSNTTFTGTISAGSTTGVDGYYLKSTGIGVTWTQFPTARNSQVFTVTTAGQTTFSFTYNVNYLDVFVNGVKLPASEFTASNGTSVVLDDGCFANDTVELVTYNTVPSSSSGAQALDQLNDVSITGTPVVGETLQHNGSAFVNDYTVSATTTSTSQTTILSLPVATYRSAEYTIQVTEGTKYHVTKILAIHDGTNVTFNEYGTLTTSTSLSTFALDVNSGNMRLLVTPASTNSTVFKVKFTGIKV